MKKVCIIRQGYFPHDVRVRKEALALIDKGYHVDVICLQDPGEEREKVYRGVNIYRIPMQHRRGSVLNYLYEYLTFFFLAGLKVSSLFFRNRYDFIQVNTLPDFLVFATLIPKIFGARVILDLHEPAPELWGSIFGFDRKFLIRIVKFAEQISIRYADKAITVSEQMKGNYINRGAPPSKISVILNVPNLEFNPDRYKEYYQNHTNEKFLLICHGLIVKRYGQQTLIKAVSLLKDKIPSIQLNILGKGEYEGELKKLVSDIHLEDYVRFHGVIPFDDMIKMIAKSDIGVVPVERNPYSDLVHTNKMFELIAMKKPVIISKTRAVEEFFSPDNSCLKFFESGDEKGLAGCILELYNNPEKREKMVKNAYAKFESVRWEKMQEVYCSLFV
jgi:glycosyltransferase involved in cell wall biosynthesis